MRASGRWCGVVAAVGLVACGGEVPVESEAHLGEQEAALATPNGTNLNGTNLNGTNLNGTNLNGTNLNGERLSGMLVSVSYAGARVEGSRGQGGMKRGGTLDSVWLEGSVLQGRLRGQHLSGRELRNARFTGNLDNGQQVELRVDAVQPGSGTNQDVWTYRVTYHEPANGHWYPLCKDAHGRAADAIAVAGRWDYRQGLPGVGGAKYDDPSAFTFACEGAAIAKCIRYGYKPWASVNGVSLATHHQACTRLVRADYCGDGTSHTVDGQWVNLFDSVGVQHDTESWALEAEWDTEGARCFTSHNRAKAPVTCQAIRTQTQCGTPDAFSTGTLLRSETP